MSGWLETLPSGRTRAVYRDEGGDRHSKTFSTRKQAQAFLAATLVDLSRGQWIDPRGGQIPFAEWAERWSAARFTRVSTAASDAGRLRNHLLPFFGPMALKDVSPLTVRSFVAQLSQTLAPKTVRNVHALLSTILRDAVLEGLLLSNPCAGIRAEGDPSGGGIPLPRPDRDPGGGHASAVPHPGARRRRDRAALGRAGRAAAQPARPAAAPPGGDADAVRRERQLVVRRAQDPGDVTLPPSLVTALAQHLEGHQHELVFTSENGDPCAAATSTLGVWRPAVTAAGLVPAPRFHDLRHSHVAMLIGRGRADQRDPASPRDTARS